MNVIVWKKNITNPIFYYNVLSDVLFIGDKIIFRVSSDMTGKTIPVLYRLADVDRFIVEGINVMTLKTWINNKSDDYAVFCRDIINHIEFYYGDLYSSVIDNGINYDEWMICDFFFSPGGKCYCIELWTYEK